MELTRHETFGIKDIQKNIAKALVIMSKNRWTHEPKSELSLVRTVWPFRNLIKMVGLESNLIE